MKGNSTRNVSLQCLFILSTFIVLNMGRLSLSRFQCCTSILQVVTSQTYRGSNYKLPGKYSCKILFRWAIKWCREFSVSRRRVSSQPLPSLSSSRRCVYAKTLASNRPGVSAPKNHLLPPSSDSRAVKASSAWLYSVSALMTAENFRSSFSAARRSSRAIVRRTKGLLDVDRMYSGSAMDVKLFER